jgi:hypothetical protein
VQALPLEDADQNGKLWRISVFQRAATTTKEKSFITLIKKKIKFSSYKREFRMEQLQSHIWLRLTASSYMGKYLRVSSYIRKHCLIYDFATAPLWISLYMRKIWLSFFISVTWCRKRVSLFSTSPTIAQNLIDPSIFSQNNVSLKFMAVSSFYYYEYQRVTRQVVVFPALFSGMARH